MNDLIVERILIIMAMEGEAKPIIHALNLQKNSDYLFDSRLLMGVYTNGKDKKQKIMLLTNGASKKHGVDKVATQAAAITAWEGIKNFNPNLIINAGTAGGLLEEITNIGDIYISKDNVSYFDRKIPIKGFDAYGIGTYKPIFLENMVKKLNLKSGNVATSNSLIADSATLIELVNQKFHVKEMEAAAIAEICEMTSTPFFAVKAVTNVAGGGDAVAEEFNKNFELALENLSSSIVKILDYLENNPILSNSL